MFIEDFSVGQTLPPLVKAPITQLQLVQYAGASGDFNPVHVVEAVGRQTPFGGTIAHGMLVMAFAGQAVTGWLPQASLRQFSVRFVDVTRPDDRITVSGAITAIDAGDDHCLTGTVTAHDQTGAVKLQGQFRAVLPSKDNVRIT